MQPSPDPFPDRGIVADSGWIERRAEYGHRRTLYRVRSLPDAELYPLIEQGHAYANRWAIETQRQIRRGDGTLDLPGEWTIWSYGKTAADAIRDVIQDSAFRAATSVHEWHAQAVAEQLALEARATLERETKEAIRALGLDNVSPYVKRTGLENEAEQRYHAALKRARLYSAALAGSAPEAKIKAIREEVIAWCKAEKAKREAERDRLLALLA